MVRFSKYEFYNKLLSGVILFRITSSVIWTQPYRVQWLWYDVEGALQAASGEYNSSDFDNIY